MRRTSAAAILGLVVFAAAATRADVVFQADFERPGAWQKRTSGNVSIDLVPGGVEGKCLKITAAEGALAYYTLALDPAKVRGKRLVIRAKVKLDNVVQGPQTYATAKIHVGYRTGTVIQHAATRFLGTMDWRDQVLVAPIPQEAEDIVLDLGLQNASGTVYFDDLLVDDGVRLHAPVALEAVANTNFRDDAPGDGRGFLDQGPALDLRQLPVGEVRLGGIDFCIPGLAENFGRTCLALRGLKRPDLPARIETAAPVGAKAARLFFLVAALGVEPGRRDACLVCTVTYADGKIVEVPLREGVDVGPLDRPEDLRNWKVAWTARQNGGTVGLGVAAWTNDRPDVPIEYLRFATPGTGAVPVLVAVSLEPKRE